MGTLKEDITKQSDWIVKAFAHDKLNLDYSIKSFIEIDRFFIKHTLNGKARKGGRLSRNLGPVLFSIASYVGESLIKNADGSFWITDDTDPRGEFTIAVQFPTGGIVWPVQRVWKRFENGSEDSIYVYGYQLTKDFINEEFDSSYWELKEVPKAWWNFW